MSDLTWMPAADLRREVKRLRELEESVRWSCAWWDRTRPDAPAFEVTDHFRRLLEDSHRG